MASTPIPRQREIVDNRESVLRTSILESALELGVGTSRTVTHWIFNPVEEVDEDAESDAISPSLTYASTATSEEALPSNFLTSWNQPGAGISASRPFYGKVPGGPGPSPLNIQRDGLHSDAVSLESQQRFIQFDLSATPEPRVLSPMPVAPKQNKLRKWRAPGNESDGGYLSDSGKGKKDKKSKKKDKKNGNATEYESDGGYLSDIISRRKTSKTPRAKDAESPATDHEIDRGSTLKVSASSSQSKKSQRPRKTSLLSPTTGDESDGGYLSEASVKKRGFFRLNTRSPRKKRDLVDSPEELIPPVPALPPMQLPIAERFLRSETPNSMDAVRSRTVTPVPSQFSLSDRGSSETWTSAERDKAPSTIGSISSHDGLIRAFRDAESVRHPSIDTLSTFNQLGASTHALPKGPSRPRPPPASPTRFPDVPTIALPKAKGSRPTISAPNTSTLITKHVPAPLVLTPSSASSASIRSQAAQHFPISPDPDYVIVTPPGSSTPTALNPRPSSSLVIPSSDYILPSPSATVAAVPPSPTAAQYVLRPHVQAYYELPPPTPPPRGPLPDVPSDVSSRAERLSSRTPSVDSLPMRPPSRLGAKATTAIPPLSRALSPSITMRPSTAPAAHSHSEPTSIPTLAQLNANGSVPLSSQPASRIQRGRESPFPTIPIHSHEDVAGLARKTSTLAPPGAGRIPRYPHGSGPVSADNIYFGKQRDAQWQPRSASALDRPSSRLRQDVDIHRDEPPKPDIDDEMYLDMEDDQSLYEDADSDDRSLYADEERSEAGDRSSMWSVSEGRQSFMDTEKSAKARERFVKRVEAMYGESGVDYDAIPPVPHLSPAVKSGLAGM
ncbi:predicted protein [Sparassis crispa]|uniref:Uncharacterized protein n=1 Tax=Sparassis crispa TaxID=139825 RepID=A0A401GUF4_9APHY|nr:predicted protein [Sparassis crispa]GBE85865.1 predicted protein [Sparassis crispa]